MLPGKGNFFRGRSTTGESNTPGHIALNTAPMLRAVRTFYDAWNTGNAESCLQRVASKQLHISEPIWQVSCCTGALYFVRAALQALAQARGMHGMLCARFNASKICMAFKGAPSCSLAVYGTLHTVLAQNLEEL